MNPSDSRSFSPALSVTIGAVTISFSGVWVKLAHVGPTASAFYRLLFGGIVLGLIVAFRRKPLWNSGGYFLVTLLAAFLFSLDLFAWHRSITHVGPGLATILANFQVFFLSLIGIVFFKERIGANRMFGMILAMAGLFLIVGVDWRSFSPEYRYGVVLGIATALFYTGYILSLKRLHGFESPLTPETNLMYVSLMGATLLGLETWHGGESLAIPDGQSFFSLFCMGVFGQVLGWVFISSGLSRIRASLAGLILLLQPSLAFVWDVLFFQKELTWHGLLGALISLSGIYLGSVPPKVVKK